MARSRVAGLPVSAERARGARDDLRILGTRSAVTGNCTFTLDARPRASFIADDFPMTRIHAHLQLRPMRPDEFPVFRDRFVHDWADDLARIDDMPVGEALRQATQRTDADLPDGVATPRHHLFSLVDGDETVGTAWMSVTATGEAFLDDLTVRERFRGQGYGRRALELLELHARSLGRRCIDLHVYTHNTGAIDLYQRQGYRTTGLRMRKALAPLAGDGHADGGPEAPASHRPTTPAIAGWASRTASKLSEDPDAKQAAKDSRLWIVELSRG